MLCLAALPAFVLFFREGQRDVIKRREQELRRTTQDVSEAAQVRPEVGGRTKLEKRVSSLIAQRRIDADLRDLMWHFSVPSNVRCLDCGVRSTLNRVRLLDDRWCVGCVMKSAMSHRSGPDVHRIVSSLTAIKLEVDATFDSGKIVGTCLTCGTRTAGIVADLLEGLSTGCWFCDRARWGVFYLAFSETHEAVKVGSSTLRTIDARTADHARNGWQEIARWNVANRFQSRLLERWVLWYVRERYKEHLHVAKEEMPQGGFSETFPESIGGQLIVPVLVKNIETLVDRMTWSIGDGHTPPSRPSPSPEKKAYPTDDTPF